MYKCIYNLSMDEIKSVYEFAWLTTQQIVVTSDKNGSNIKGLGNGFFFQYRDKLFFVTADHVIHPDDFEICAMALIRRVRSAIIYLCNMVANESYDREQEIKSKGMMYGESYIGCIPDEDKV